MNQRRRGVPFLAFLLAGLIAYLGLAYFRADGELAELQNRSAQARTRLRQAQEEKQTLNLKIEQLNTDRYVEKVARENLGLAKPGEIPYLVGKARNNQEYGNNNPGN